MKLADLVVCRTVCSSRDNVGSRFPTAVAAVYVVFVLLCCGVPGQGAKLLLVPLASESHIAAFTALSTALEQHGGLEVHMVVSEGLLGASRAMAAGRNASHAHAYLTYPLQYDLFPKDMADLAKANSIQAMAIGFRVLAAMTDMVIGNKQLLQEITALQPDLVIGDATASFGHWLTSLTGTPSIEFDVGTSSGLLHSNIFGGQFNPAYVPAASTFYPSTGMTLKQRCINTAATVSMRAMSGYFGGNYGPIREMADRRGVKHLPGTGPHKPLLLLVNFDWALEPPRPVAPSTKYLGPLMPTPPAQLPDNIQAWLDMQPDLPVVYVSFGASFAAPETAIPAVASALAGSVKQMRFVVSMKTAEQQLLKSTWQRLGQQPSTEQVLLLERVPQNDLLGSGRIAAFVTQGGYLSMQEAAYHSVPVISIPLSLGQEEISQFAVDQGRGIVVRKETLMAGHGQPLLDALRDIVAHNSAYSMQAELISRRLKAHPRSPGQQAADWVAYALANPPGSGSFLHTQGQDMPWWQVLLLDVAAVAAAVAAASLAVLMVLLRLLAALFRRPAGGAPTDQFRLQEDAPGTPSPAQSPVALHEAGHKAGKGD